MKKIEEILLESFIEIDEQKVTIEGKQRYIDELIEERSERFKKNKERTQSNESEIQCLKKELRETRIQLDASRNLAHKQQERLETIESEDAYIRDLEEQITTLRTANDNLKVVRAEQDRLSKELQTEIFNHKCGYENSIQTIAKKDKIMEDQRKVINELKKDIERLERDVK